MKHETRAESKIKQYQETVVRAEMSRPQPLDADFFRSDVVARNKRDCFTFDMLDFCAGCHGSLGPEAF